MKFRIIPTVFLLAVPLYSFAVPDLFPRALRLGMLGEDVRALQVLLNTDSATRVAEVGVGASGNETNYFGPATKRAVAKFQNKYKSEILLPLGLTVGTGFFGESTRIKANTLLVGVTLPKENPISPISTATPNTVVLPATPSEFKGVVVKTPSQYSGKPGTSITISGWGFTKDNNTINFGDSYQINGVKSFDGYNLSITVPNIPKGVYIVSVNNVDGASQTKTFFSVTDGASSVPVISSITPDHATRGDRITIKGSGFAATGNMLRTTLKVFENVPAVDSNTIMFTIPADTFTAPPAGFAIPMPSSTVQVSKSSLPIWIYVVNENGVSNGKSFVGDF